MKVILLDKTQNGENLIATSAKLCYSPSDIQTISQMSTPEIQSMLSKIIQNGHHSVLEHVKFTFGIEGISRALTHQLVRHRMASYSQQSQRYVKEKSPDYIIPDSISSNQIEKQKFIQRMEQIHSWYIESINNGVPKEDARYYLPNATETKIIMSMNVRELLHFFELRCCSRAQTEIRKLANSILEICRYEMPLVFQKAGASCVSKGFCPEGEMSCKT